MTVYVLKSGDFDLYHKYHYFNTYEEAFKAVQAEVEGSGRYTAQEAIDGGLISIKEITEK